MHAPAGASGDERLSRPMAGRQLGRYEILTQLASGGMASVYIARAQGVAGFERMVAIKVLHPHLAYEEEFISMFLDEARLAARIRHMNVVPTLDISDSPGDGYFLVMEYIEGNHLGALLGRAAKKGERLPRPFVCRVLIETLQGLSAAHRLEDEHGRPLKLVHRDVSPHNILIGTDGIARLTDFGVAKADVRIASTRSGQFKGKLSYMAPEQAASNETDQRSDLFSAGIILWESLTGRRLFKGGSNAATLNNLLNAVVPKPSALWHELAPYDTVVMKALDRDPAQRFQSAEELAEALENAAGRSGVAKTRDVAEVVRTLDSEKLEAERTRVRDAIEQLGRTNISQSDVPMPREGASHTGQTHSGRMEAPRISGTVSTVLSNDRQLSIEESSGSVAARWLVMLLAIVVFLYAGFLVWQLLGTPPSAGLPEASEGLEGPPLRPVTSDSRAPEAKKSPERKNSTDASRPKRRRARRKALAAEKRPPEVRKRSERTSPASEPAAVPIDIDIENPYRN